MNRFAEQITFAALAILICVLLPHLAGLILKTQQLSVLKNTEVYQSDLELNFFSQESCFALGAAVDLNAASVKLLQNISGVGKTLAHRIVEERNRGGRFRSVGDLHRVRGLGKSTIKSVREANFVVAPRQIWCGIKF